MIISLIALFYFHFSVTNAATWGYLPPYAPANWSSLGYPLCGGNKQSPIDIVTAEATYDSTLTAVDLSSYSSASGANEVITLTNSGHSVSISITYLTATPKYTIKNGGLSGTYVLDNLHFHWGPNDLHGSEHEMNGHAYPLEVHFVHYRKDLGSVANAKLQTDGLAVLGFFFTVSTTDNANFDFLFEHLANVSYRSESITLPITLTPSTLLPSTHANFYRYEGSLTTPTCDESVVWTVFENKMTIGQHQLAQLRELFETLPGDAPLHLEENFRPVQPLNDRTVTTNKMVSGSAGLGQSAYVTLAAALCVAVTLLTRIN